MSELTDGDFTSRYEQARVPTFVPQTVPDEETWQQREQLIGREIAAGPDKTVSGFVWNFNEGVVRGIESALASGDFATAKKHYDYACGMLDENREDIISLSQIRDTGRLGDELAKRAGSVLLRDFNQNKVKLSDGSEVTIGQALAEGSPFLADKTNELKRLGFGDGAAQLYMDGDRAIRAIMDPFISQTNGQGGPDSIPNRIQLRELADSYAQNYDRVNGVFEDGTQDFLDYVRETHKTSGNAAATMRSLLDFAETYSSGTGVYGKQLASDVVGGYNDLLSTVFRGDEKRDARGVRFQPEISDNQRREFDAILIPTIKETISRTGKSFDLHDPRLRQSMLEVADTLAYTSSLGGDMFSDARTVGSPLNKMFGAYVSDGMLGVAHRTDNIVESVKAMRSELSSRLVGGRDAAELAYSLTGQSRDYLANVDKVNGSQSSCREADNLAADAHKFIAREMLPRLAEGSSQDDAFARLLAEGQNRMVDGLASRFVRSFHGSGREELAAALSSAVLAGFASGERVCVEELVGDLAHGKLSSGLSDQARRTAKAWYDGNVADALKFSEKKSRLYTDRIAQGFSDAAARSQVAAVTEAAMNSPDPNMVFDRASDVGMINVPVPQIGPDGKPVLDKNKNIVYERIDRVPGSRNSVNLQYGGNVIPAGTFKADRASWDAFQVLMDEERKRMAAREDFRQRKLIAAETSGGM